ncbi:hypothetical protein [Pukyongia salina]|uniref:hypothetical protein n=1 Tax=Pukyongia salina TaxID=2094025 RepID=UPI00131A173F|nr:hypothetical protein [Pukyongia salina]
MNSLALLTVQSQAEAQGRLLGYLAMGIFCVALFYYVFVLEPKRARKKKEKEKEKDS